MRNAYNFFVGKPEGKNPFRRWCRGEDSIRIDSREIR
jgi:hypothetical protein